MKRYWTMLVLPILVMGATAKNDPLSFRAQGEAKELNLLDGQTVRYTAYTDIRYVTNVEDSAVQTLNFFVPEGATQRSPILLRTYVGGYRESKAKMPSALDATGRALQEGLCVCIPGSRGNDSATENGQGQMIFTGKAPYGLADLKAVVRYLRYNDKRMMGSAERIITDGTSAGGAMSALLGATANHPDYEPILTQMGAAKAKDNVFAAVCYCPITDLDHADMAYEWLYQNQRKDVEAARKTGKQYERYINELKLRNPKTGELLTSENYMEYMKSWLTASANRFVAEGGEIDDSLGFGFATYYPPTPPYRPGGPRYVRAKPIKSGIATDVDLDQYLSYVVSRQALKEVPAFDNLKSPECRLFGDTQDIPAHFTGNDASEDLRHRVRMMNPMYYISDPKAQTAPHWYIRHGALDRDTSFPVAINLATKLMNEGREVDFALPWNRCHEGDYNLDDLFRWIRDLY